MKHSPAMIACLLAIAAACQPREQRPAEPPIRFIAAQVAQAEARSREELGLFFRDLKLAGFTTVIFRAFQDQGDARHTMCESSLRNGYYFQTGAAPLACDILGMAAEEAHNNGLKFIAWVNTRYADYGIEDRVDLHALAYDLETRSCKPSRGLSIFQPEVQARLAAVYRDLGGYPIDGVLVQDDLMMRHNEDFSAAAILLYEKETGRPLSPERLFQEVTLIEGQAHVGVYGADFQEWQNWKAKKLLELADLLRASLRSQNPALRFGCNFYYETGLKPDKGLLWFSQDAKLAAQRKHNFYSLMLYHRQMGEELGLSGAELDQAVSLAAGNFIAALPGLVPVIKIMTRDFKDSAPLPQTEIERVVSIIRGRGRAGIAFFPVSSGMDKQLALAIAIWEGKNDKDDQRGAACGGPACGLPAQER